MVAIAATSKLTASGITVGAQEVVHFLLQHHGQHLPSPLAVLIFEENVADFSNYGFWLGYSRDTLVLSNRIRSNRLDGIAIEAGRGNRIKQNTIIGNRTGIRLWRLASPTKNAEENSGTGSYVISNNEIKDSREWAIVYPDDLEVRLAENRLENNRQDVLREPAEYANPTVDASE